MSREIKFRAWTHQNPPMQWFSKNVAITGDGKQMTPIGGTYTGIWQALGDNDEKLTIEQYTGLKDKNGKETYEGDIVKYKLYADSRLDYIDEVFYSNVSGAFMVGDEDNIRTLDCLINVEVIGNIHDNPELLGGKE